MKQPGLESQSHAGCRPSLWFNVLCHDAGSEAVACTELKEPETESELAVILMCNKTRTGAIPAGSEDGPPWLTSAGSPSKLGGSSSAATLKSAGHILH